MGQGWESVFLFGAIDIISYTPFPLYLVDVCMYIFIKDRGRAGQMMGVAEGQERNIITRLAGLHNFSVAQWL